MVSKHKRIPDPPLRKRPYPLSGIYYRPFIPLLLAFIAGLFFANQTPGHFNKEVWPTAAAVVCIFISAGMLVFRICRSQNAKLTPLLLFFSLGFLALMPWLPASYYQSHLQPYYNETIQWQISGVVKGPLEFQGFRTVCFLDSLCLSPSNNSEPPKPVPGKVRAVIYGKMASIKIGDTVTLNSKIRPFRNFKNAGAFDYAKYMTFQGVWGSVYTGSMDIVVQTADDTFYRWFTRIRQTISTTIGLHSEGEANAILNALILGNREGISSPLREAFNRSGISHLLAISGLHIGIVASFSFFLFTWLLSRSEFLLRHAWTRKGAAVLSLLPILVYGIMAGMSPSTQRAVIMVSVFLLTFLIGREHDMINSIAIAALIILITHPPALLSISFQLSFAAVLSIVCGIWQIPRQDEKPERVSSRLINTAGTFILISGLAIIGTAPLTMHYFNQISFAGFLSNLIFVPLIGFVVVPVGLFSVLLLLPLWEPAAGRGLELCHLILTKAIDWVYWISSLPYSALKTVTPSIIEVLCLYALFGSILYLKKADPDAGTTRDPRCDKQAKMAKNRPVNDHKNNPLIAFSPFQHAWPSSGRTNALIVLGLAMTVMSADIFYWAQKRFWGKDLTVSILDVGQGNAALIEMPGGQCALIDGGGYTDNSIFDVGERVVAPFLWRKKIATIETVILTHYDTDHLNGLLYIIKHFNVRRVYANHDQAASATHEKFQEIIHAQQIHYPPYEAYAKTIRINGVVFNVLYPPENFSDLAKTDSWRNSNNNSLVTLITFGDHTILFPGDIMKEAENELSALNKKLRATIMLAPHHGSKSSSRPEFLEQIAPQCVIVSCGAHNRFGFPSPDVLERYEKFRIKTLRTDINGQIEISTDGRILTLTPMIGKSIRIEN